MKYIRMHGLDTKNYWRIELDDNSTLTIIKYKNGIEQNRASFNLAFTQTEIGVLISALIDLIICFHNDDTTIRKLVEMREFFLGRR